MKNTKTKECYCQPCYVRAWVAQNVEKYETSNELATSAAKHYGHLDWLEDENHWVFALSDSAMASHLHWNR
jgi:hypothetical protein